jgi:SAM-dependent methyltransferase
MSGVAIEASAEAGRGVDFDRYANGYENDVDRSVSFTGRDSTFYARRKVEILEEIVRQGPGPLRELSLLDVGCGTGTTDQELAPRVRSLHGVDISVEMLAKAQQNVPEAQFSWFDGETLPFDDGTFDVVVAICVLHHVPVPQRLRLASEMVRVSRHEGVVAVFEHNPYNPLTRHAVNTCELDRDAVLLPPRETAELLKKSTAMEPEYCQYLFSPLGGATGRFLDRHLRRIPLGGQYATWVRGHPVHAR